MASAAAKRTTYSIYSIEVNMKEKALLSHSGRLAFSLPNSPNETSFTHLVDDPEDFNKAPFCLILISLKRG
jgi:hypothetical protein